MTTELLAQLQTIDPEVLTGVVQQDQRSPTFEITSWTAGVLSDKGATGKDALILCKGEGRDAQGSRPWSVVLKALTVNPNPDIAINHLWHWGRELAVSRSDLMDHLPGQMLAPRCYGSMEWEGHVGLWMEFIAGDAPDVWDINEFSFAARRLGQFNAACLNVHLPPYPWLVHAAIQDWLATWSPEAGWDNPIVQRHLSTRTSERIRQLWSERHEFLAVLDAMPQLFSHGDTQRRNLILRKNEQGVAEMVAVDWALCGIGPLGADPTRLVGTAALFFDWKPDALQRLDECVFEAYLAGLLDAGWHGDLRQIRLAFTAYFAMKYGVFAPRAIATFTRPDMQSTSLRLFGCQGDALAAGWVLLNEHALNCADEARIMMHKV